MQAEQRLEIEDWIIGEALSGRSAQALLEGFCRRLTAAGFQLWRVNISQPTLHPIIEGYLYIWRREADEVEEDGWLRGEGDATEEELDGIPFAYMWRQTARSQSCSPPVTSISSASATSLVQASSQ